MIRFLYYTIIFTLRILEGCKILLFFFFFFFKLVKVKCTINLCNPILSPTSILEIKVINPIFLLDCFQWSLVCDKEQLKHVAEMMFLFGVALGGFFSGLVSDR